MLHEPRLVNDPARLIHVRSAWRAFAAGQERRNVREVWARFRAEIAPSRSEAAPAAVIPVETPAPAEADGPVAVVIAPSRSEAAAAGAADELLALASLEV